MSSTAAAHPKQGPLALSHPQADARLSPGPHRPTAPRTTRPTANMAAPSFVKSLNSWKYSMPLIMENRVQAICRVGTITMAGNSLRP